ncbi:MAG: phosphatase PAP2 family protein [Deltaproteobacteria bacterium]|nr:phosphatase PAP2 family protein [Deltaproteobacteria bacterium]
MILTSLTICYFSLGLTNLPSTSNSTLIDNQADPFTVSLLIDAPLIGGSAALFASTLLLNNYGNKKKKTDRTKILLPFDKIALNRNNKSHDIASTYLQNAMIISAPLAIGMWQWDLKFKSLVPAFIITESLIVSSAICHFTKSMVRRPRPYSYTRSFASGEASRSFYSAHTTVAFAAVTSTTSVLYHLQSPYTWPVLYAGIPLAATVGILRVSSGKHFPSDVIVGALAGASIGILVPYLHRSNRSLSLIFSPSGLAVAGNF